MSPSSPHRRMQSSTRMDVLSAMLSMESNTEKPSSVQSDDSPRDSLSPLDGDFGEGHTERGRDFPRRTSSRESAKHSQKRSPAPPPLPPKSQQREAASNSNASTRSAQAQKAPVPHITFQDATPTRAEAAHARSTNEACSPRFPPPFITRQRRPTDLKLSKTNGLTTISTADLKRRICDGHTASSATESIAQVPRPKLPKKRSAPLPRTPAIATVPVVVPPVETMGNAHSGLNGQSEAGGDDIASLNSVVRRPMRVLRKSSTNLFKRIDSKSPLPRPLTATSIIVTQEKSKDGESPIDPFIDPAHKARDSCIMLPVHSASTMTVTDESQDQPLSASTTIKDLREASNGTPYVSVEHPDEDERDSASPPPVPEHCASALSPTIPAPSPLPQDSPHQYGLKDRMDTPELVQQQPVEDINVQKARRRASGVDIFKEAKSLQSASSFLNGLSTSRRRAESTNRDTDTTWATTFTGSTSRPSSARPGSARLTNGDYDGRRRGHNFKSNGFAYARSLNIVQLKCYRQHARLLVSKNKHAPVECGVCHMDDEQDHWTCSWCAIRMCRFCRKDFAERGMPGLRERIKVAEGGVDDTSNSSAESLITTGRGRSRAFV